MSAQTHLNVTMYNACLVQEGLKDLKNMMKTQNEKILCSEYIHGVTETT
jgi:hypothetical protein